MDTLTSEGRRIFNVLVGCSVISTIAVALRFGSKASIKGGFGMDDAWMIFTMACYFGSLGVSIWGLLAGGGGLSVINLILAGRFKELENYALSLFIGLTLYLCVTFGLKMTLLSFYKRIFIVKTYETVTVAVMVASTAWFVGSILGNVFNCKPIDYFWIRTKPGSCGNFNNYIVVTNVIEMIIDITIFILPTRMVIKLHVPTRTKVLLASIFMFGIFTIVTSIIRLRFLYQKSSIFVNFAQGQFWSAIHLMTGIICASVPLYKPLWSLISGKISGFRKFYASSLRTPLVRSNKADASESLTYVQLQNKPSSSNTSVGKHCGVQGDGQNVTFIEVHSDERLPGSSIPVGSGIFRSDQFTVTSESSGRLQGP